MTGYQFLLNKRNMMGLFLPELLQFGIIVNLISAGSSDSFIRLDDNRIAHLPGKVLRFLQRSGSTQRAVGIPARW